MLFWFYESTPFLTQNKSINLLTIAMNPAPVTDAFVIFTQNDLSISPKPRYKNKKIELYKRTNYFPIFLVAMHLCLNLLHFITYIVHFSALYLKFVTQNWILRRIFISLCAHIRSRTPNAWRCAIFFSSWYDYISKELSKSLIQ